MMTKEEKYKDMVSGIKALIEGETDMIAVMSNVAAEIHQVSAVPVPCHLRGKNK